MEITSHKIIDCLCVLFQVDLCFSSSEDLVDTYIGYELLSATEGSTTGITVHGTMQVKTETTTPQQDIEDKLKKTINLRDVKVHENLGKSNML